MSEQSPWDLFARHAHSLKQSNRERIIDLAGTYSWETIAREMIAQMSEQEAKDFADYFEQNYS